MTTNRSARKVKSAIAAVVSIALILSCAGGPASSAYAQAFNGAPAANAKASVHALSALSFGAALPVSPLGGANLFSPSSMPSAGIASDLNEIIASAASAASRTPELKGIRFGRDLSVPSTGIADFARANARRDALALSSARALENASSSRFQTIFDGALSGARRLAAKIFSEDGAPTTAAPKTPTGLTRVSVTINTGDEELSSTLDRLSLYFGFRPDAGTAAPSKSGTPKDAQVVVLGVVPTDTFLPLANAKGVLELHVLPGAPEPNNGPRWKSSALTLQKTETPEAAPKREPFVAATRRVAGLELLAKNDPEKAHALAIDFLEGRRETRREVRWAALRVLEAVPLAKLLPFYQKTLDLYAELAAQEAKAQGVDSGWYIQRAILGRFAREAEALKADERVVKQVKTAYEDRNASVRLAAAAALRAMGIDPGPENDYLIASRPLIPHVVSETPYDVPHSAPKPPTKKPVIPWKIALLGASIVLGVLTLAFFNRSNPTAPVNDSLPTASQVQAATPAAPAAPEIPVLSSYPPAPRSSDLFKIGASPADAPVQVDFSATPAAPADPASAPVVKAIDKLTAKVDGINSNLSQIKQAQQIQAIVQANAADRQAMIDRVNASQSQPSWMPALQNAGILLAVVIVASLIMNWLFKRFSGGGASGNTPVSTQAKTNESKPTQRFSDIEGIDEALVNVQETVDFIRDPARFERMGAHAPKGILFEGPPGTGKTLMAKALAGETNSAFFAVSGSDFVELYVGMGARRVRELIQKASNHKPAIIFIDEIDAVGKTRGGNAANSNDEREQTLNALLVAMDGFGSDSGITFVAATNRAELLDPALLRRLTRKIYVGKPHTGGREGIATIHARNKRLSADLDLAYVARRTSGLSGADIENVMEEAALLAVRRGADAIEMQDVDEAIDSSTIGSKRSLPMSPELKRRIAYHEGGHALEMLLAGFPVNKYTIIPHGSGALGFAEQGDKPGASEYLHTRDELESRIDITLGGLAAEKMIFGKRADVPTEWSTGPSSDLEMATKVASSMVQRLGMGETTGLAVTAPSQQDPFGRSPFGDAVGEKAWNEVNKILAHSHKLVIEDLARNRKVLEALAEAVLTKETILGPEIEEIVRKAGGIIPRPAK